MGKNNENSLSRFGGWIRFGDPVSSLKRKDRRGREREITNSKALLAERERKSILSNFVAPATTAGHGVHVKNLYNLYVYFWRWALWKVFEQETSNRPGVVSFISASSYIDGDAFCGMREHMRRQCDEIWIIDIGGEGRGTRKSDNVFAIQTPVAIAVAVRSNKADKDKPAKIHYTCIEGKREMKLAALDAITDFTSVKWEDCPDDWLAPFRPAGKGKYFDLPLLTDLMPWQHPGAQFKRTWPIGPDIKTLEHRWSGLLNNEDRSKAFRGSGDREVDGVYKIKLTSKSDSRPIADIPNPDEPEPNSKIEIRNPKQIQNSKLKTQN